MMSCYNQPNMSMTGLSGMSTVIPVRVAEDRARSSNGDGDSNNFSALSGLNVTDWPLSVSMWVKGTQVGSSISFLFTAHYSVSGQELYYTPCRIGVTQSTYSPPNRASILFWNQVSGYRSIVGSSNVNDGEWHNIVAVITSTTFDLYVDGVSDAAQVSHSIPYPSPSDRVRLFNYWQNNYGWDYSIDEVVVWDTDQSANVAAIYNGGEGVVGNNYPGTPVHRWSLSANNPGGWTEDQAGSLDFTETGTTLDVQGIPAGQ